MPIKKILVPLSGHEGFEAPHEVALETGLLLGERFAAHVEAFHAAGEAAGGRAFIPAGMPGSASEELMRAMEGEDRRRGERARALFAQVTARHNPPQAVAPGDPAGFSVDYVELPGPADELIAARGRLADLTICPSPSLDDHRRPPLGLEAALRETGRPLLVVPPEMPETLGKRVAIGWNGSVEASRALALGWDLVAGAEEVIV
ncbi:MAG: universal stress protein, partial [Inquilinus sp.]|nr:universal stress protein [Inquilinus sp.]